MPTQSLQSKSISKRHHWVWILSVIAISPILTLAAIILMTNHSNATFYPLLDTFKTGSAVILSFAGGARWGLELRQDPPRTIIIAMALVPAACGWISLFLPEPFSIAMLLIATCAIGAWDSLTFNNEINTQKFQLRWYANVRTIITLILAVAHGAVLLAILN